MVFYSFFTGGEDCPSSDGKGLGSFNSAVRLECNRTDLGQDNCPNYSRVHLYQQTGLSTFVPTNLSTSVLTVVLSQLEDEDECMTRRTRKNDYIVGVIRRRVESADIGGRRPPHLRGPNLNDQFEFVRDEPEKITTASSSAGL